MIFGPYLTRQQALALGAKSYLGADCKVGHGGVRHANKGSNCIECRREILRQTRENWPGGWKNYMRDYYAENGEKMRATSRAQHWKKRDELLAKMRERYWLNPVERRAASLAWSKSNAERKAEYSRLRYLNNKDYYRNASELRRARKRGAEGRFTKRDIEAIWRFQEGNCAYFSLCGRRLIDGVHIDHAEPLSGGGSNWPENIQLTCPTCNLSKGAKEPIEFLRFLLANTITEQAA